MAAPTRTRISLFAALVALAALLGLTVPWISEAIDSVGRRIYMLAPGLEYDYAVADYLLSLGVALGFTALLILWPMRDQQRRKDLVFLWVARCAVVLGFMLIYEKHFSLDAFAYFGESLYSEPRYPLKSGDTYSLFIHICWWLNQYVLPFPSYHTQKLLFAFVGFFGSNLLYSATTRFLGREDRRMLLATHLLPSIIFWSSILGKDPITYFAVSAYLYGVSGIFSRQALYRSAIWIILGVSLSYVIRPWMAGILAVPLLTVPAIRVKNIPLRVLALGLVPLALHYGTEYLSQNLKISTMQEALEATNQISRSWSRGGSAQEVPEFRSTADVLAFAPIGIFTALFRPLPGEILNPFGLMAGIENLVLLLALMRGVRRAYLARFLSDDRVVALFSVVLSWSFVYGFVSYQNLGSAVRFKLQALPPLLALILFLNYYKDKNHVRDSGNS